MAKRKTKYNWEDLKQEFFNSEILEAKAFIRQRLGIETNDSGNIARKVTGWANAKKEWTKNKNAEIQRQLKKELMEKLKIPVEESLGIKSMISQGDARYLTILLRIGDERNPPSEGDLLFFKAYPDKLSDVWKRVQIELGLPVNVSELQGSKEKPLYFKDLVEKAEKILGKDALK